MKLVASFLNKGVAGLLCASDSVTVILRDTRVNATNLVPQSTLWIVLPKGHRQHHIKQIISGTGLWLCQ